MSVAGCVSSPPRVPPPPLCPPPQRSVPGRCRFTWGRCLARCPGKGGGVSGPCPSPAPQSSNHPRLQTALRDGPDATEIGTCWRKYPSDLVRLGDWGPPPHTPTHPPFRCQGGTVLLNRGCSSTYTPACIYRWQSWVAPHPLHRHINTGESPSAQPGSSCATWWASHRPGLTISNLGQEGPE